MAADWAPVIQTGIGAVAALGGGAIGAWLQAKSQERIEQRRLRHEERVERQQRRDRAAVLLGEVSAMLMDSQKQRLLLEHVAPDSPEFRVALRSEFEGLMDRQKVVREQLAAMAIAAPSPEVRRLVQKLEGALGVSLSTTWYRLVSGQDGGIHIPILAKLAEDSERRHLKAVALFDELIEAL